MECKISVKAGTDVIHVPIQYPTIQEAINHANPGDTIFVHKRTYYEHVIINKSVALVGEDRDSTNVDGNGTGSVISITANYVSVKGFTIERSGRGPYDSGIFVNRSSGNDVSRNTMTNNSNGISLYFSSYNTISHNTMTNNSNGISLLFSIKNMVSGNTITNNNYGISLFSSINNMVSGNTITNNNYGMYLALYTMNNIICCNNFNNTCQVRSDSTNVWDYGNQGNYWSDYAEQDLNGDGIGDKPYVIDIYNQDNHPLKGTFSDFNVTLERETYHVTTICNSTISEFRFEMEPETGKKIISFNVTGKDSTVGFCRVTIPTDLMNYPYIVLVDVEEIVPTLLDVSNETYVYLYFTYSHSRHTIRIIYSLVRKLQTDLYNLNTTYCDLLNNYSIFLDNYSQLQKSYHEFNKSYQDLLNNYSIFLDNYSQLQKSYHEFNKSYQDHLSDYSKNIHNVQNLMYIFAATTAVFIITIIYLSKRAHAGNTKAFEDKNRG